MGTLYHKRVHNVCNKHVHIHIHPHIILKAQLYLAQFVFGEMLKCLTLKKYSKKLKLKDIPIRPHGKFIKVPVLIKENSQSILQERYGRGKPLLKIHVGGARGGLQGHRIKTIRCSLKIIQKGNVNKTRICEDFVYFIILNPIFIGIRPNVDMERANNTILIFTEHENGSHKNL